MDQLFGLQHRRRTDPMIHIIAKLKIIAMEKDSAKQVNMFVETEKIAEGIIRQLGITGSVLLLCCKPNNWSIF